MVGARPVAISTMLCEVTDHAALARPIALVAGVPMFAPVGSINCAMAHVVAMVVTSSIVTEAGGAVAVPIAEISEVAALAPKPASPPAATIYNCDDGATEP